MTHKRNVKEMLASSSFGKGKSASTRRRMAFGAAYRKARESGAKTRGGKTILRTARGIRARRKLKSLGRRLKK